MRILQIAIGFEGGIGKLLVDYCTRMKNDIEFEFLIGEYENGRYENELKKQGFEIYHIQVGSSRNEKNRVLTQILKTKHYDVVHIHGGCDYTFLKCAKYNNVKTRIVHSHNALIESRSSNPLYKLCRNLYREILNKLYVTEKWACGIEAGRALWGDRAIRNENVFIMPNAIQTEKYRFKEGIRHKFRRDLDIENDALVIGTVGRLTYQKNQRFMIKILSRMLQKHSNVYLIMIGDGELEDELKQQAEEYEVDSNIRWLGNRKDVPSILNTLDVFLLTSYYEGLPVVMIEAQANGLPCIVSDVITRECNCLSGNRYISLSCEPDIWAREVTEAALEGRNLNAGPIMIEHGFEINSAVCEVKNKYLEAVKSND